MLNFVYRDRGRARKEFEANIFILLNSHYSGTAQTGYVQTKNQVMSIVVLVQLKTTTLVSMEVWSALSNELTEY